MSEDFVWTDDNNLIYVGIMPENNKQAFDISISKWEHIIERLKEESPVLTGGPTTCGLCVLYYHYPECDYCPIRIKTGKSGCENTPIDLWDNDRTLENAEAELAFLLSLKKELGYE